MAYKRIDEYDEQTTREIAGHVKVILRLMGEDPEREGLLKTPSRVAKALQYLTKGYGEDGGAILRSALFDEKYRQMVLVKDIDLYSMCEHHMLPFIGKAHVAYIPNGKITGLSKIARVVETYARRLQVQERLTVQIRDCIQENLEWRKRMRSRRRRLSPGCSSAALARGTNSSTLSNRSENWPSLAIMNC